MDGHSSGPVRSRSSQSASPSHSASISASSSAHRKRKFHTAVLPPAPAPAAAAAAAPFSLSDTGALTSNDDLDSISARDDDDDDVDTEDVMEEEEEDDDDEDDDDEDNDSIRTFTAARLNPKSGAVLGSLRSAKPPKPEIPQVKSKLAGGGLLEATVKEERVLSQTLHAVKEEPSKGVSTESIQTSGAYISREEGLKREEESGKLRFLCSGNDGIDEHMIWLIGLKNIFARQLPNMPKEYIVRLVMDRTHKSMMVIRHTNVVGGITYRPYASQRFGEIAFCAITSDEQVKGYGTRLMNHLKQHARDVDGLTHFLTYADNNAVGYFIKQGFTKEIPLEKEIWQGYIKDYDGGLLMECKIDPKLPYTDLSSMIRLQKQALDEKIRELSNCHIVYPGIDFQKKEFGISRRAIKVEDIPGLREAGWTPDQWGYSRFKTANACTDEFSYRHQLNLFMRDLLKMLLEHNDSWPFKEPVDARDVTDYYEIIKDPIDLKTMSKRVESEQYYVTLEMFVADVKRMCSNARIYNSPETIYYRCANRVESFFMNKVQTLLQQIPNKIP